MNPWRRSFLGAGAATAVVRRLLLAFCILLVPVGTADAQPSWQKTWDQTVAAARSEGAVAVIGPPSASHRTVLMQFEKAFPGIRVEYSGMRTPEYVPRLTRERSAGQYRWDIVVTGFGPTTYNEQIPAGWYDPVKAALILPEVLDDSKWLGGFDAGFLDAKKRYAYAFALDLVGTILVNRDAVPQDTLKSTAELLDPRWTGKIAMYDPRVQGQGELMAALLRMDLGDDRLKKLLLGQQVVFTRDGRQLVEWIVRGRYPIGLAASGPELLRFKKQGLGLNVIRLQTATRAVGPGFGGVVLMNRAPHPNAARVFLNWLLGREAQQQWALGDQANSRRLDVASGDLERKPDATHQHVNLAEEKMMKLRSEVNKLVNSARPD